MKNTKHTFICTYGHVQTCTNEPERAEDKIIKNKTCVIDNTQTNHQKSEHMKMDTPPTTKGVVDHVRMYPR
jgi:hypothetical protein